MRVLFTAAEIAARVDALAMEIADTIPAEFVMVGLLKSAVVFVADLARALRRVGARPEIEFMRLSSYSLATESSGAVQLLSAIPAGLPGRAALIVDDIVDTGRSIAHASAQLHQCGISDLWTCALLDKPQRREIEVKIDFVGFSIDNVFRGGLRHRLRREISPSAIHWRCGMIRDGAADTASRRSGLLLHQ
jgi:hypoxanthine phosphoribosyltransferase